MENTMIQTVAVNLKRFRAEQGLTQPELAKKSGVSISSVKTLETCKATNPSAKTLGALARALNRTIGDLLTEPLRLERIRFRAKAPFAPGSMPTYVMLPPPGIESSLRLSGTPRSRLPTQGSRLPRRTRVGSRRCHRTAKPSSRAAHTARRCAASASARVQLQLRQCVPRAAGGAFPGPIRRLIAAFRAAIDCLLFCHVSLLCSVHLGQKLQVGGQKDGRDRGLIAVLHQLLHFVVI